MFTSDRDQVLFERLNHYPRWRARVESLLEVVEDARRGTVKTPMRRNGG